VCEDEADAGGELDPLSEVIARVEQRDHEEALFRLQRLTLDEHSSEVQARALAIAAICVSEIEGDENAGPFVNELIDRHESDEYALLAAGIQLSDLDALPHAERLIRRVCRIDPDSPIPKYNLALVLKRAHRYDEALEAYEHTLSLDEWYSPAWLGKASCLQDLDRLSEAAEAYYSYLSLEEDDAFEWVSVGIIESNLGNYDGAIAAYERAQALEPRSVTLLYNWAVTASRRGDRTKLDELASRLDAVAPMDWRTAMIHAYQAGMEEEVSDGWKSCVEAVELAYEDDEAATSAAAEAAVAYAGKNGLHEEAQELVQWLFEAEPYDEVFNEDVLSQLRALSGSMSRRAVQYVVMVEATLTDRSEIEAMHKQEACGGHGPPYRYFRNYGILAESREEAAAVAVEFERRRGGKDARAERVDRRSEPSEAYLGAYWCPREATVYSANAPEE